jgi:uncharacterized SAM-binding protein YcdF (DUF218 family)
VTPPPPRDAIVVLGARLGPGDALTAVLRERVAVAAWLFHGGAAPRVMPTGGVTGGARRAEAAAMADGLRAAGVPAAAIVVEDAAQTTAANAARCAALLATIAAAPTAWLVTQPFHAARARYLFRRAGVDAEVWHIAGGVEAEDAARAWRWRAREVAAWAKLALTLGRGR